MEHECEKATLIPAVAAKIRDAANLTHHFHGGHLLRKAIRHPSLTKLVIIFIWFDKGYVVINSLKIIWIFKVAREIFIWLKNSTLGISNSEDFHYLHRRLVADYPGHVTTYFCTQCQRPVHPKDLICDIWHSMKISYPYTKAQSPTPFNSNPHPSHFCTKLRSKTQDLLLHILWQVYLKRYRDL